MAFGKKKSNEEAPAAGEVAPLEGEVAGDEPGEVIDGAMFASAEGDAAASDEAAEGVVEAEAGAPDASADPLAGGGDLLSMFQTTTLELEDKSAILDLAGETEMDDLLEELQTVVVALGIRR